MATSIQVVNTGSPTSIELRRQGGCIIAARVDFWAGPDQLAASVLLQKVKLAHEVQHQSLAPGRYDCMLTVRVEESLNGVFAFEVRAGGDVLGAMNGNVNTTSSPNDSRVLQKRFALVVG